MVQDALAVALLEVILPPVGVFLPVGEHGVNQSSQPVGSGRHRFGFAHASAHAPVVRAQRRQGKRGGARVIYFNANTETIWLLIVYKKAKFDNLPTSFLVELKQGVEDAL